MARPRHEFAYADGTPEMRLLGAATVGDLALLERMARQLDGGRGRIAEAVEAVKDHGVGALHLATGNQKLEVCEFLVEDIRVDVDAVDICGRTSLVWAINSKSGHVDIVRYLLDHGANPNSVDKTGFTPLHEAAKKGCCEVVELLLSRGAYVDPFSTHHGTPLHVAAKHKQDGAMKTLLDHHADDHPLSKMSVAKLKEEGDNALHKDDYEAALEFYTMAMTVDPANVDSTLIGNRGFCRLNLGYAEGALNDAHCCRTMRPNCAHSCWLQGYSYVQLQEYEKACDAFLDGLKLKPRFIGIEKALREALRLLKESHIDKKNGLEERYRESYIFL